MDLSYHLSRLRKAGGFTQKSVADHLTKYGPKSYTFKTVSQWETGVSEPSVEAFLLLCELYGVDDIRREFGVSAQDGKVIPISAAGAGAPMAALGQLNSLGRARVGEYTQLLLGEEKFRESSRTHAAPQATSPERAYNSERMHVIRLYDLPVSAGTGEFLDGSDYEEYETPDDTAEMADFAVRVCGNSMEPQFEDGQVVFVRSTQTLRTGDIGIFTLNGEGYCKELGNGCLISLNPDYEPIEIGEYDSLFVLGEVLG